MTLKTGQKIIGSVILLTLLIVIIASLKVDRSLRILEEVTEAGSLEKIGMDHAPAVKASFQLFDWDGDGHEEFFELSDGTMSVKNGQAVLWQSPPEWQVTDFVIADSMQDGQPKLNLVVWKPGSYGQSKPFWQKQEDTSVKNHLFIMRLVDGRVIPAWQSSNLPNPICELDFQDVNHDGLQELVAQEGDYGNGTECDPKRVKHMEWKMWNFFEMDE